MKAKAKCDEPLKVPLEFDEAMRRAEQVKPPAQGWTKYMKKLMREQKRRRQKSTAQKVRSNERSAAE